MEAEEFISHAMKMKEVDSEMLFFRACIRYLMKKFEMALDDVRLAIDKAEDNIAEHYVLRGLCFAAERNYAESTQDFTIALQLKESLEYIHWFRSRSAYLVEDTNLAFNDLQRHMLTRSLLPSSCAAHNGRFIRRRPEGLNQLIQLKTIRQDFIPQGEMLRHNERNG